MIRIECGGSVVGKATDWDIRIPQGCWLESRLLYFRSSSLLMAWEK